MVRLRTIELLQKLSRFDRQGLHVASLAFGVERIKCQAGFSAAAQPADRKPLSMGYRQAYIFQIVDSNVGELDFRVSGHARILSDKKIPNSSDCAGDWFRFRFFDLRPQSERLRSKL